MLDIFKIWRKRGSSRTIDEHTHTEPKIEFAKDEDMFKMSISEGISFNMFFDKLDELAEEDHNRVRKLPLSILDGGLIRGQNMARKGNYFWFEIDNKKYFIVISDKEVIIEELIVKEEIIEERDFLYELRTGNFTIGKKLHEKNYSTLEHKKFESSSSQLNYDPILSKFSLSIDEAKIAYKELFDNLFSLEKIYNQLQDTTNFNLIRAIMNNYFSNNKIVEHENITHKKR